CGKKGDVDIAGLLVKTPGVGSFKLSSLRRFSAFPIIVEGMLSSAAALRNCSQPLGASC
ncbi:hypothetical protein NDU88_002664, partial [Pleurodeles waltl]